MKHDPVLLKIILLLLHIPDGCSPTSPLANGSICEYNSGAVGAMLTFQCDTGYMPQEEVTSTCLSNGNWVPTPECEGMRLCVGGNKYCIII